MHRAQSFFHNDFYPGPVKQATSTFCLDHVDTSSDVAILLQAKRRIRCEREKNREYATESSATQAPGSNEEPLPTSTRNINDIAT